MINLNSFIAVTIIRNPYTLITTFRFERTERINNKIKPTGELIELDVSDKELSKYNNPIEAAKAIFRMNVNEKSQLLKGLRPNQMSEALMIKD